MDKNSVAVGIGEALWDMLPDGKKVGGAPANFAFHIGQYGLPSCLVSAVGKDALGDELLSVIESKNLNAEISRVAYPTGTVDVTITGNGIPSYVINENVAWDYIPFTDKLNNLAARTKAVCFGSLAQRSAVSRATIIDFIRRIPVDNDALKVFDVNLRQHYFTPEILKESMHIANILKINDEELEMLRTMLAIHEKDNVEQACRKLIKEYGLKMVILTCGTKGSYVITDDEVSFLHTPLVEVADTVGAGDSFTAAFIASILKGKTIAQAHRKAVDTSAFVCSNFGAMPQLPPELTED